MGSFIVFIFGAIIGSFLNVCIYRMPLKKSVIFPRSYCPNCKNPIPWYNNIPVISYILLLGRCGKCRKMISLRYPLVELLAAVSMLALYSVFGLHVKFFAYSVLICGLIVVTFIDFHHGEIPDSITLGGLVLCLIAVFIFPGIFNSSSRISALVASVIGLLAGAFPIYMMGLFGKAVFKREAMGGGDVKLMALIGSVLGWRLALFTFFLAPFFGAFAGIFLRLVEGRQTIPYGPYLSLAAVIAIFFGNNILRMLFYGM